MNVPEKQHLNQQFLILPNALKCGLRLGEIEEKAFSKPFVILHYIQYFPIVKKHECPFECFKCLSLATQDRT